MSLHCHSHRCLRRCLCYSRLGCRLLPDRLSFRKLLRSHLTVRDCDRFEGRGGSPLHEMNYGKILRAVPRGGNRGHAHTKSRAAWMNGVGASASRLFCCDALIAKGVQYGVTDFKEPKDGEGGEEDVAQGHREAKGDRLAWLKSQPF